MIIYKVTNLINSKIYIGQTTQQISKRWNNHCCGNRDGLGKAIKKYSKESFKVEIIDNSDNIEDLNKKEEYWITHYNSTPPNGYNLTKECSNHKCSDKTKEKLRNTYKTSHYQIINLNTSVVYDNISEAANSLNISRRLINNNVLGYTDSSKGLTFVFLNKTRKKESETVRDSRRKVIRNNTLNQQKEVRCLETNVVFPSIKKASEIMEIARSSIQAVLVGKNLKAKGYSFEYTKDKLNVKKNKQREKTEENKRQAHIKSKLITSKQIVCIETKQMFVSIKEASRVLNINHNSIRNMLGGRSHTAGGYSFRYLDEQRKNFPKP